jgi:hypothetical protein
LVEQNGKEKPTLESLCRGAQDLAENDFPLEGPKYDEAKFD